MTHVSVHLTDRYFDREKEREIDSKSGAVPSFLMERPTVTEQDLVGKSSEEQDLMKMMGFGSFDSTKVSFFFDAESFLTNNNSFSGEKGSRKRRISSTCGPETQIPVS